MGGGVDAASVDVSSALASYQAGADVIEKQFPIALQQYAVANTWAQNESIKSYLDAKVENYPISQTAIDSTNELRKWMGMAPIDSAVPLADSARGIASYFTSVDGNPASGYVQINSLSDDIKRANSLTDPTQRAAAKAQILNKIDTIQGSINTDLAYYASKDSNRTQAWNDLIKSGQVDPASMPFQAWDGSTPYQDRGTLGSISALPIVVDDAHQSTDPTQRKIAEIKSQSMYKSNVEAETQLGKLKADFEANYKETPEVGYTSDQIMQKLQETPGYQVQYQQGAQALDRTAAARGMLLSGNTMQAAAKYGADYAQGAYQQQIANLANLAGITMPAQQQGVQNTINQGNTLANLALGYGTSAQQNTQDIARSRESAFIRSGDAQLQAAMMNAQLKQQASMANAQSMGGIGQLAGSVLGMIL